LSLPVGSLCIYYKTRIKSEMRSEDTLFTIGTFSKYLSSPRFVSLAVNNNAFLDALDYSRRLSRSLEMLKANLSRSYDVVAKNTNEPSHLGQHKTLFVVAPVSSRF